MRRSDLLANTCVILGLFTTPGVAVAQEGCKPLTEAKKLPALSALLDSASVVANLPAPDQGGPAEVLVSVMTGATPRVFVMDSLAAQTAAGTALVERVTSSLKPSARNAIPAFRLRVVFGQAASANVEPSVLCAPRATGAPQGQVSFTVVGPAGPPGSAARPPRPQSVTPRIKIGVNGEVLQVDLGSGTGYPDGDRSLRQSLEGQRYEPALLDGRPVQVWLKQKQVELVR
jgi:hypothetical protein